MRRIALFAMIAACGGSTGPTNTNTNPDAGNSDSGYPSAVTVELGLEAGTRTVVAAETQVEWHNAGAIARSCELVGPRLSTSTGEIAAGATSPPQTLPAGTYQYRCGTRPEVQGTLIVQ